MDIGDPSRLYLGRVVGVGATRDGMPLAIYAVSGRSEGSRQRRLVIEDDSVIRMASLGEPTPEQLEKKEIFFYPAIKTGFRDVSQGIYVNFAAVSNGVQTEDIHAVAEDRLFNPHDMVNILRRHGHEGLVGDKFKTPRIAGLSDDYDETGSILGIVTDKLADANWYPRRNGAVRWISTYCGGYDMEKKEYSIVVPEFESIGDIARELGIAGRDAQELADELYGWMNKDLVVSTGVAAFDWEREKWKLAVKNRHG